MGIKLLCSKYDNAELRADQGAASATRDQSLCPRYDSSDVAIVMGVVVGTRAAPAICPIARVGLS
jgi:hypothetical protein